MSQLLRALKSYSWDLCIESYGWVSSLFSALGIVIYFSPGFSDALSESIPLARRIGLTIFLVSFVVGNFRVYRRVIGMIPSVSSDSLKLYAHNSPPNNGAEIHYFGCEPGRDLVVKIQFRDRAEKTQEKGVEQFYNPNDTQMIGWAQRINVMHPDQSFLFRLPSCTSTSDRKVNVRARVVGTRSGRTIEIKRTFDLKD